MIIGLGHYLSVAAILFTRIDASKRVYDDSVPAS